jgi:hypothetical protein
LFFKKTAVLACWLLRRDHETRKESRKERKKERKKEGVRTVLIKHASKMRVFQSCPPTPGKFDSCCCQWCRSWADAADAPTTKKQEILREPEEEEAESPAHPRHSTSLIVIGTFKGL